MVMRRPEKQAVEAALSVAAKAYYYRLLLSCCFLVLMVYGILLQHTFTSLFVLGLLQGVFCADILLKNAWQDVLHARVSISVLAASSVLAAFGYNLSKTFFLRPLAGAIPDLYIVFSCLITVYLWESLSNARQQERTQVFIKKLHDFLPKSARLLQSGKEHMVFAQELKKGDEILVKAGEMIPCEGIIKRGSTHIDESLITGNMLPADKTVDNWVYAGTLNQGADIVVQVDRSLQRTIVSGIIDAIANSERRRSHLYNSLHGYARWVWVWSLLLAVGGYLYYYAGHSTRPLHSTGMLLLGLSLGCPLSFFFSVLFPAYFVKLGAKRRHIHVQVLGALAILEQADAIFFDKTGTLTYGELSVSCVQAQPKKETELWTCLATAEQTVDSPFARAINQYAQVHQVPVQKISSLDVFPSLGVKAQVGKHTLLAGRAQWLKEQGVKVPSLPPKNQTIICAAKDGHYLGYVTLEDTLRPGAAEMVAALRQKGKEIILMSGDHEASVKAVALEIGIDKINYNVFPQTKAEIVGNYASLGKKTVMIGDGFNDIVALLRADAGIVFSSGKNVYNNWVDIILYRRDLYSISDLFGIYRRLRLGVWSNVGLSIICSGALWAAVVLGQPSWWQRAYVVPVAVIGSILILFLNSVRLLRIP